MPSLEVTSLGVVCASDADRDRGLLGWVTIAVNNALMIDGIALRRTRDGRLALSYPTRTDRQGKRRPIVRPLDDETRLALERQVLDQLVTGDEPPEQCRRPGEVGP